MRRISYVTGSRADFGISRPIMDKLQNSKRVDFRVLVCGMHLSQTYGRTVEEIEAEGFCIGARIPMLIDGDSANTTAQSMARGIEGFANYFAKKPPDILVVLGDRFEMYSAAIAALPFAIPVAHIHGGELTLGAFDDSLRHSMTKLSHLHFAATETYARRIRQLGEEDWRITVSGAPSLDNLKILKLLSRGELERQLGLPLCNQLLLVTVHPATLEPGQARKQIRTILDGVSTFKNQVIFTLPNADPENQVIFEEIGSYVNLKTNAYICENLGTQAYFTLMGLAGAMVGNSSSGLIEAPSLALPVVNIGRRQDGRLRAANIIDVDCISSEIVIGIEKALSAEFQSSIKNTPNPHGNGNAAVKIVDKLLTVPIDDRLLGKAFVDHLEE